MVKHKSEPEMTVPPLLAAWEDIANEFYDWYVDTGEEYQIDPMVLVEILAAEIGKIRAVSMIAAYDQFQADTADEPAPALKTKAKNGKPIPKKG